LDNYGKSQKRNINFTEIHKNQIDATPV